MSLTSFSVKSNTYCYSSKLESCAENRPRNLDMSIAGKRNCIRMHCLWFWCGFSIRIPSAPVNRTIFLIFCICTNCTKQENMHKICHFFTFPHFTMMKKYKFCIVFSPFLFPFSHGTIGRTQYLFLYNVFFMINHTQNEHHLFQKGELHMLELYPNYYPKFTCTADQCPITCCQEWKISVDDDTHFLPIPLIKRKLVSFAWMNKKNVRSWKKTDFAGWF